MQRGTAHRLIATTFAAIAAFTPLAFTGSPFAVGADEPAQASSTVKSDPVYSALLIDGSTISGRVEQLQAGGEIRLIGDEAKATSVPLAKLVKLTRDGQAPPPASTLALVVFPDGDRLRSVVGSTGETTLEARSYVLGDVSIPLESLLGIVFAPPEEADAYEELLGRVREQPRKSEVLWLANGDRMTGSFLGLSAQQISFQPAGGALEVERSQAVAIGFDPAVVEYPRPKEDFVELTLTDGSRLGAKDVRIEKGQVSGTTRFGVPIHFAIGDLAALHRRGSSIQYLSEREPDGAEYAGYVGPARQYRRNLCVDGYALRLAGRPYDLGLGTQSRTLLAYRIKPGTRRFQALVGLDDRAGPLGSVVFRVVVDKEERYVSPPMSVRDTPRPVDIDVSGAKVIVLVTEFGERGDVRDFGDWVEARLIW